jgi:hypothetical protein
LDDEAQLRVLTSAVSAEVTEPIGAKLLALPNPPLVEKRGLTFSSS